jgi:SNF2 family DNA or RNA helicase
VSVKIEKRGRRIEIRSREPVPGLKTAIPGAYLNTSGVWTVPLSLESCKLLREKFGRRLDVGNELMRWARGVVESRQYMAELSAAEDAELEILHEAAPALYKAMLDRPYQKVGARFVADNTATLVADDPGLGKTLIAMGGILEAQVPGPYLVVAPKTASDSVWKREIERWLPDNHRAVTMPELRPKRERKLRLTRYGPTTWLIVHPEMVLVQAWWECTEEVEVKKRFRNRRTGKVRRKTVNQPCGKRTTERAKQQRILDCGHVKTRKTKRIVEPAYKKLLEVEWGSIIVDESHESLIKRAGATTQRRRGLEMLKLRGDGIKLAMSGTPFNSKPHQLWGTLNWLDPMQYSAFYRWAELYWQRSGYAGTEIGDFRPDREPMLWDSLSAIALRRTKEEVAPDLPPKIYVGTPLEAKDPESPIGVWLEMDGKQAKAYAEMEKLSIAELDSGRLEALTALAELTRLKQLASCYGDIHKKMVKARCQGSRQAGNETPICRECKRSGWHEELHFKYVPQLPSNKFDWVAENLEEWGYPRDPLTKVVIVSFYTGILEKFGEGLEKHFRTKPGKELCTAITGKTPSHMRRQIIDDFNKPGSSQVMLLNVKAGGTAITIDSADRTIFVSETRIPDQQRQAEDRTHRVSNPRQCFYYYLRSMGTVDVGTALVNQEMIRDTSRLLDGRRGVQYVRHVLDLSHRP